MNEKPESDEFEEDEDAEPVADGADVDLDQVNKELDLAKRRGKLGEVACGAFSDYARPALRGFITDGGI